MKINSAHKRVAIFPLQCANLQACPLKVQMYMFSRFLIIKEDKNTRCTSGKTSLSKKALVRSGFLAKGFGQLQLHGVNLSLTYFRALYKCHSAKSTCQVNLSPVNLYKIAAFHKSNVPSTLT